MLTRRSLLKSSSAATLATCPICKGGLR